MQDRHAIVLLSGGLDSATTLAMAVDEGFACTTLAIDYGQTHAVELRAAAALSERLGAADHRLVRIDLSAIGGSALTDASIDVPTHRSDAEIGRGIPITYVPARNMTFLAVAMGLAEVTDATDVFIGVNAIDYSGYPDCRPAFIAAFAAAAALGTKRGVEDEAVRIRTPLIELTKAAIIRCGTRLGVPYDLTVTCYQPTDDGVACATCDACHLRRTGFSDAGVPDPTRYQTR